MIARMHKIYSIFSYIQQSELMFIKTLKLIHLFGTDVEKNRKINFDFNVAC